MKKDYVGEEWFDILPPVEDELRKDKQMFGYCSNSFLGGNMTKLRYRTEKDQIIDRLWEIINRNTEIDDAGCDWFTVGHLTYIADTSWCISDDAEVAKLVNAINALNGYPELIYANADQVSEHRQAGVRLQYE